MTIEEKARAYDEALERARALRQEAIDKGYAIDYVKDYEAIFPELAESEDERIRKELKEAFEAYDIESTWNLIPVKHVLAWLEKQKEQKPAEWSEEEKLKLNRIYAILGQAADTHAFSTTCRLIGDKEAVELQDFLRSIAKPESGEWSEEDEKMLNGIIERGNSEIPKGECGLTPNQVAWLETRFKSLRPQFRWKPSEEQMDALEWMLTTVSMKDGGRGVVLKNLINDIKKLM